MARGRANLKSPIVFDIHFVWDVQHEIENRINSRTGPDSETGEIYEAELTRQEPMANWLDRLDTSISCVSGWQALYMCEQTNTLVFCCNGVICLLRDYKRFFEDPSEDPEWFAAYYLYFSGGLPEVFATLLERESVWLRETRHVETSLSVRNGRALWVSAFPLLIDWSNAKSVEDVKINLLCQDYDSWLHNPEFYDSPGKIDPSTFASASTSASACGNSPMWSIRTLCVEPRARV